MLICIYLSKKPKTETIGVKYQRAIRALTCHHAIDTGGDAGWCVLTALGNAEEHDVPRVWPPDVPFRKLQKKTFERKNPRKKRRHWGQLLPGDKKRKGFGTVTSAGIFLGAERTVIIIIITITIHNNNHHQCDYHDDDL